MTEPLVRFTGEQFETILAAVAVAGDPWCGAKSKKAEDHNESCPLRAMIQQGEVRGDG